jgi:hypothetical protein
MASIPLATVRTPSRGGPRGTRPDPFRDEIGEALVRRLERAPLDLGGGVGTRSKHVRRVPLAQLRDVGRCDLARRGVTQVGHRVGIAARERATRLVRALARGVHADRAQIRSDEHRIGRGDKRRDEPLVEHHVCAQCEHRAGRGRRGLRDHHAHLAATRAPQRAQQPLLGGETPDSYGAAVGFGSTADHPARRCRR